MRLVRVKKVTSGAIYKTKDNLVTSRSGRILD